MLYSLYYRLVSKILQNDQIFTIAWPSRCGFIPSSIEIPKQQLKKLIIFLEIIFSVPVT